MMRTRRAKTVPPGAAMGPRMVQAERKMEAVTRRRVRRWADLPCGGQTEQEEEEEVSVMARTVLSVLGEGLDRKWSVLGFSLKCGLQQSLSEHYLYFSTFKFLNL